MQMSLHHESIADALREVIQAAGGAKAVGERMFPDMPIDHAASRIRDCLNHDRGECFTPDQVMMILRMGHQAGCHAGLIFIARELWATQTRCQSSPKTRSQDCNASSSKHPSRS